jgi:hypothetical protein
MTKNLPDYLSVTRTMTHNKAVTMKVPTPIYTPLLLSTDFGAAVRRNILFKKRNA